MYDNFSRNKLMYNIKVYHIQICVYSSVCTTKTVQHIHFIYLFDCDTSDGEDKGMHDDGSNLVVLTGETIIPITPPEASSNWTGCLK